MDDANNLVNNALSGRENEAMEVSHSIAEDEEMISRESHDDKLEMEQLVDILKQAREINNMQRLINTELVD